MEGVHKNRKLACGNMGNMLKLKGTFSGENDKKRGIFSYAGRRRYMKQKVPIIFKISAVVLVAILITAGLNVFTVSTTINKSYGELIEHYIGDIVEGYGEVVREAVEVQGEDAFTSESLMKRLGQISIQDMESSYAYMTSLDGIMLYHPTAEKIGQPVENSVVKGIVEDLAAGKSHEIEVVEYEYNGAIKYAGIFVEEERGFILIITADKDEMFQVLTDLQGKLMATDVIALLLSLVVAYILVRRFIAGPVNKLIKIITKIKNLDFTENEETKILSKQQDEIGSMSKSVEELRKELCDIIRDIQSECTRLYSAANDLNRRSEETSTTVGQIETAVQEIATGATSQASETQNATENVILIGNMVEETNEQVIELRTTANEMKRVDVKVTDTLKRLNEINQKARKSIDIISEQTNTTNISATKIREATTLITSIAEETNLLSLNASIEAARAGEQGRGFAVVASQIQKLAEQSDESARQIESIIDVLIADSEKAVETMAEVMEIMEKQSEHVDETEESFAQVQEGLEKSIDGIDNIAERTQHMDEARGNVVDVVQNLTAIAQENAASTQETSASVTEMSNIVLGIAEEASELHEIASSLEQEMKKFRV